MKKNFLDRFKFNGQIPEGPKEIENLETPNANSPNKGDNRRDFIRKSALGGLSLGLMFDGNPAKEIEFLTQKVNRSSNPSDLKITDVRIAVITKAPMTCPIKNRY